MSTDNVLQLQQPLKEGAIHSVNFFNGRLLASKDLTREQQARREADWRNGLAIGDGVAFGLDVTPDARSEFKDSAVVQVTPGLAINRAGQTLRLTTPASVALTQTIESAEASRVFAACKPITGGTYVAGAGVYVLTIAPAELNEGYAQTNGRDPSNVRCNVDRTLEAVQFRLLLVPRKHYVDLDVTATFFRNALAYRFFGKDVGTDPIANLLADTPRKEGLLESLRPNVLTDCDVPLAVVYIHGKAEIGFVDCWAVRRGLSRSESSGLRGLVEPHRPAVGAAMFMQFQTQIATLSAPMVLAPEVTARSHFLYLPPVGVIPAPEERSANDAEATHFFAGMTYRNPLFIQAARLEGLVRESLCYPPIDTQDGDFIWLYRVRENRMAIDFKHLDPLPRSYVVFATCHLRFRADAEFDAARWDYSNYTIEQ